MQKLNLPEYQFNIVRRDNKLLIFDNLRRKFLVLSPEEWVRQNFTRYLINQLKYPKGLIKAERGLSYNQLKKRTDIVIFGRDGLPFMVIECKAPAVSISQKTFHQVAQYNSVLRARFVAVTNGLKHYCCRIDHHTKNVEFLKDFPSFATAS